MAETESITVAEVSDGPCGTGDPGTSVDLPVVELLTGRGFVTGKSGSGKSNTASVIAEKLLDNGFGMLIVDIDGEYYGLKEEYEILHAGADEECDIQVTVEHAEKLASLALEKNVPIILDISSFLDEDEAEELLTEVARQLFAKAKKQKQPFLLLVEECHEWMPEKGSMGEVGQMLIKIGKRGRKHGLGMVGISQRPADVKKDYITQCDWLVWHRLTWNNDTKVVGRILDNEYADAVEDLNDGEAFLMTDWSETIRRVQFHRKKTFDAGATPGLDDFERPDLKSVSDDLVSELTEISDEKQEREDRIAELREELDEKNSRIAELEAELQDARDMQRMAEQFTSALVEFVEGKNPGKTEQERMRERRQRQLGDYPDDGDSAPAPDARPGEGDPERPRPDETAREDDEYAQATMSWPGDGEGGWGARVAEAVEAESDDADPVDGDGEFDPAAADSEHEGEADDSDGDFDVPSPQSETGDASDGAVLDADGIEGGFDDDLAGLAAADSAGSAANGALDADDGTDDAGPVAESSDAELIDESADADLAGDTRTDAVLIDDDSEDGASGAMSADGGTERSGPGGASSESDAGTPGFGPDVRDPLGDRATEAFRDGAAASGTDATDAESPVAEVCETIERLEPETRQMLRYYRDHGPGTPIDALFAAGGSGDRTEAYARNRRLRVAGLVRHAGRGRYEYSVPDVLEEGAEDGVVEAVERALAADDASEDADATDAAEDTAPEPTAD